MTSGCKIAAFFSSYVLVCLAVMNWQRPWRVKSIVLYGLYSG